MLAVPQDNPVEALYVDNLETMSEKWREVIAEAAKPIQGIEDPAEAEAHEQRLKKLLNIKLIQDAFHFLDRYARVTAGKGNGLFYTFLRDLSVAVMPFDAEEAAVQDALHPDNGWKAHEAKLQHCRRCAFCILLSLYPRVSVVYGKSICHSCMFIVTRNLMLPRSCTNIASLVGGEQTTTAEYVVIHVNTMAACVSSR
jgi:hypothetical protein